MRRHNEVKIRLRGKTVACHIKARQNRIRYLACGASFKLQMDFARVDFPEPEIPQVIRTIVVSSGAINCAKTWGGIPSMESGGKG